MKGTIEYLGRGLLVLALCGTVVGCGDDDDSGNTPDAGPDGGGGTGGTGTGGTGTGGKSGTKDGGTGGTGTGGKGGTVTMQQCVDMTNTNTGNTASDACVTCVCTNDSAATVACDSGCWALISCVGSKCGGDAMSTGCLSDASKCMTEFGKANVSASTALGMVITSMCSDKCVATSSGNDGGNDAGN